MDEIRRIILEAKVAALLEHAIPAFERAALIFLTGLRKGITPTLEQVTALSEELYYLQLQGEDTVEVLAPLEDELTNQKIAELSTPDESTFDLSYAPDGLPLEVPDVFKRFLEGLDG